MDTLKDVLAVLVLYNCRIKESESFLSLNRSLVSSGFILDVLVYDNSPSKRYEGENFIVDNMRITYISDIHNSGVSRAYNVGRELAEKIGKKWILLLDQDTTFPCHSIERYLEQIGRGQLLSAPMLFSGRRYLSPCRYKWGRGRTLKYVHPGELNLRNKSVLNSGLLIHLDVFKKAGEYNENIPLDFSDHEWLERVKRYYHTVYIMDLVCRHNLSVMETDIKKVLVRFKYYLIGAKEYRKTKFSFGLSFIVFLRTIKLTLRFKTLDFLRYYLNC